MSAPAYSVQSSFWGGDDVVRMSDGLKLCLGDIVPRQLVDELNRLAAENERLRCARDARTLELEREIEKLRVQLAGKDAESRGQLSFFSSTPFQY